MSMLMHGCLSCELGPEGGEVKVKIASSLIIWVRHF